MVRFIWRLSKVAVAMTESVSLRHSSAATIKQSAKAVKAMEVPTAALWKCFVPIWIMESRPIVIMRPAKPTVVTRLGVSTDWPRGLGTRDMRPGVSLSKPRENPKAAFTTKWIHRT